MELIEAQQVYAQHFPMTTNFERAIFFSWSCAVNDCTFCYMSTQPHVNKGIAKRTVESILAECVITKNLGWDIGFVSGGIGVYDPKAFLELLKKIHSIVGKVWINIGPMSKATLQSFKPYIKGVVASVETIEPELHKKACPSKPMAPYERMLKIAQELGIPRAITFIVGLGESRDDYALLKSFIEKYGISKIHFYGLNPVKGTVYEHTLSPTKEEQAWWIAQTRIDFPHIDIQFGIWKDKIDYISTLLMAGANAISKLPAMKCLGTTMGQRVEDEARKAGRTFRGILGDKDKIQGIDWERAVDELGFDDILKEKVRMKVEQYLGKLLVSAPLHA